MHAGTGYKSAHYTHHVTFGKDANIFSNYKQFYAKNTEISKKKQCKNIFNILIRFY